MKARRFAVIGDPVGHSRSPAMHAAAFRALGLPHVYEAVRVTASDLPRVVAELREGRFDGLNVTLPYKERVLSLVDAKDESARVAGAANTLVRREGASVVAHNTDAPAIAAELRRVAMGPRPAGCEGIADQDAWKSSRALVLGSGGAARAAIVALVSHLGIRDVVARARSFDDPARREAFVRSAPYRVTAQPWRADADGEARTRVLVQATTAGMSGADPGDEVAAIVAWHAVDPAAVAIDVVYNPRDTPWLRAARARGVRCDDGLGMLARQGAFAEQLWLDVDPPFEAMRAALE